MKQNFCNTAALDHIYISFLFLKGIQVYCPAAVGY